MGGGYGPNPFRPSFGVSPPVLAGRYEILEEISTGLGEGPGALERSLLFIGARGTGKTVMLNEVQRLAEGLGWVMTETATPGLVDRLVGSRLPGLLGGLDPAATGWRLKGVSGFGAGASWEPTERYAHRADLRSLWTSAVVVDVCGRCGGAGRQGWRLVDRRRGARRGPVTSCGWWGPPSSICAARNVRWRWRWPVCRMRSAICCSTTR